MEEAFAFAEGVDVAEDSLGGFKDREGVAGDLAAAQGDEAGKDAAVEVLQQDGGRAGVVPEEATLPAIGLFHQQRLQLRRGEVAQVEHFELGGETHCVDVSSVSQVRRFQLPARINLIHRETLRVVEEELLVSSAGQKLWQLRGFRGGKNEDVGVVRDAVGVVVDHVLVTIEGEAIVEIAADVLDGDDLSRGIGLLNLAREWTRRVGDIE